MMSEELKSELVPAAKPKISSLTPEQEVRLIEVREEWRAHGLSNKPVDRPNAVVAITRIYERCNQPQPEFMFVRSPLAGVRLWSLLRLINDSKAVQDDIEVAIARRYTENRQCEMEPSAILKEYFGEQFCEEVVQRLREEPETPAACPSTPQLLAAIFELSPSKREPLLKQFAQPSEAATSKCYYGSAEAYEVAYYLFAEEIGVEYTPEQAEVLHLWAKITKAAGWWWPLSGTCIVADRGDSHFDDQNRLHRLDGPAIEYRDGWAIYAIDGVSMSKEEHAEAIRKRQSAAV